MKIKTEIEGIQDFIKLVFLFLIQLFSKKVSLAKNKKKGKIRWKQKKY